MAEKCDNHPIKNAINKCKQCGKNLCSDCVIKKENGIFCSIECYQKAKEFSQKVMDYVPKKKSSFLKKIIILIIIIIAAYFGLKIFAGIDLLKFIQ